MTLMIDILFSVAFKHRKVLVETELSQERVQVRGRPMRRFVRCIRCTRCIILLQEKDGVVAQRAETVHQGVVMNPELWVRTERTGQTAVDIQIGGHDDGDETDEKDVPVLRRPEFLFHHQTF